MSEEINIGDLIERHDGILAYVTKIGDRFVEVEHPGSSYYKRHGERYLVAASSILRIVERKENRPVDKSNS